MASKLFFCLGSALRGSAAFASLAPQRFIKVATELGTVNTLGEFFFEEGVGGGVVCGFGGVEGNLGGVGGLRSPSGLLGLS
jgi:hypothetical protein